MSPDTRTRIRNKDTAALKEHEPTGAPCVTDDQPELRLLLAEHAAGILQPVEVVLGELPEDASAGMAAVAEDVRLLIGLRLAVDEDRPLPYSARFASERLGWSNPSRANRVLRRLCDAGVIVYAGSLPPRGQPHGTATYCAPPLLASAGAIEGEAVGVEAPDSAAVEPDSEVGDQRGVERAVRAQRLHGGVASGDAADVAHATDGIGETGGGEVERAERIAARNADLNA
jgi:hypothetical protein